LTRLAARQAGAHISAGKRVSPVCASHGGTDPWRARFGSGMM
jgi:hypothetical protein